jgi:hypothetical protein
LIPLFQKKYQLLLLFLHLQLLLVLDLMVLLFVFHLEKMCDDLLLHLRHLPNRHLHHLQQQLNSQQYFDQLFLKMFLIL